MHISDLLSKINKEQKEENERALRNEVLTTSSSGNVNKASSVTQLKEKMERKISEERKKSGFTTPGEEKPIKKPRHDFDKRNNNNNNILGSSSNNTSATASNNNNTSSLFLNKLKFNVKDDEQQQQEESNTKKSSKTSIKSIENIRKLIKITEKEKEKIEKYKKEGNVELVEKHAWDRLEKKAKGEKMRDDAKLLKKSLRKLQSKKKKSSKEWKERRKEESDHLTQKAQQREANLAQRKKRPGFEGKVNTILNAD